MKMEQVYGELELAKSEIEKLKFSLTEKETAIQHLTCTCSMLRSDSDSKLRKLEDDNVRLLKAIEDADEKSKGREKAMGVVESELENLKVMLLASQRKCWEAQQEAKQLKEASRVKDESLSLEEGKRKLEDELKWKKEQFELLKQAHEKLKSEFESRKRESELEKSSLLDEIGTLQSALDSRSAGMVERRGDEMLERVSMREMESDLKEAEYRVRKLEEENRDLLSSLRELQEAHIPKSLSSTPPSVVSKIKSKLRSVEQAHKDCQVNLRSKEADWSCQIQMMRKDLDEHKLLLNLKQASIKDLKKELEDANAANTELKMQNEELSLMLQLLRAEFSETQSKDHEGDKYKKMLDESRREQVSLKQELSRVCDDLERLKCELAEKVSEECEIEFELQIWRSSAERLEARLEENQRLRRELETSLLEQAGFEEQLKLEICSLRQQLGRPEYEENDEKWTKHEEEETTVHNKQIIDMLGKARDIRASDERSPFREINYRRSIQ